MRVNYYSDYQLELLEIHCEETIWKDFQKGNVGEIEAFEKAYAMTGLECFLPTVKDLGEEKKDKPESHGKRFARACFKRIAKG